jgi:hypothetical protein
MPDTGLAFHPLTFVAERDGVLVGRSDTDSYALLPEDGVELLRRLADGMPPAEAAAWYDTAYGESVDIADFVETMHDLGFVREPGDAAPQQQPVRFQAWGRAMFSPLGWICYALVIGLAVAAAVHDPRLAPQPGNAFFVSSLVVVQLTIGVLQMPMALWHEWFHVLSGRRLGLPTSLGVGRRLYFFVFETRLSGLLGVQRRQRYLPFLAGMLGDVVLCALLTLAAAADFATGPSWIGRLALALAFMTLPRLAWQLLLFLRTDLYYVLTTALGCANLHEVASAWIRHRLRGVPFVRDRGAWTADDWTERERALAPFFAALTLLGTLLLLASAVFLTVPLVLEFAHRFAAGISHHSLGDGRFWDSAASLLIALLEVVVLPMLAGRRRTPVPVPT